MWCTLGEHDDALVEAAATVVVIPRGHHVDRLRLVARRHALRLVVAVASSAPGSGSGVERSEHAQRRRDGCRRHQRQTYDARMGAKCRQGRLEATATVTHRKPMPPSK